MDQQDLVQKIKQLKEEKHALIVAHYYVEDEIQEIADYVGDSYYLSKICKQREENLIIFCGVAFMGESAKILSPQKRIIMPNKYSDCPMAHMIEIKKIEEVKAQYEDLAVVCYINSSAQIKAHADVIVTSSNAYHIVSKLKQKNIFFIPDQHLGRHLAKQLPEKHFIFNDGFCHVHTKITKQELEEQRKRHPLAEVLVHPECSADITEQADYIGSTAGMINYATNSSKLEFIICTEVGVLHELRKKNPNKQFFSVSDQFICPNMKRITLKNVYEALVYADEMKQEDGVDCSDVIKDMQVEESIARKAECALIKMHELGE